MQDKNLFHSMLSFIIVSIFRLIQGLHVIGSWVHWCPGFIGVPGSLCPRFYVCNFFLQLYAIVCATFAPKNATFCNLFCNFFATFCCNKKKLQTGCKNVAKKLQTSCKKSCKQVATNLQKVAQKVA